MAGMFFTMQEVVDKFGKDEAQVRQLIEKGKLRVFLDGTKQLFKTSEVQSLVDDLSQSAAPVTVEVPPAESPASPEPPVAATETTAPEAEPEIEIELAPKDDIIEMELGEDSGSEELLLGSTDMSALNAPKIEDSSDDSLDLLATDDAPAEALSLEESIHLAPAEDDQASLLSDDSMDILMPDDTSATPATADIGDSFDLLLDDDTDNQPAAADEDNLLSDDTLSGLLADEPAQPANEELLSSLTKADTAMGTTGINVLAESDGDYQLASDTKAETTVPDDDDDFDLGDDDILAESTGLGNLDDDLNLDSIGSGSGLLDLSLQADDTSLGAVLDDILPDDDDDADDAAIELGDESVLDDEDEEQIFEESVEQPLAPETSISEPIANRVLVAQAEATAVDNACGVALFLPALMVAYAAIVLVFGVMEISPGLLTQVTGEVAGMAMIWIIVIAVSVLFLMILIFAALLGGGSGEKKVKKAKPKKAKKVKTKKEKKVKPKKEKKPKAKKKKK